MVIIHVSIQPIEGVVENFEIVLRSVVEEARRVPGCLRYEATVLGSG